MKILITGGDGFLGSYLCRHLQHTHEVVAPGRQSLDVCDAESVNDFFRDKYDWVIHCAVSGRNHTRSLDPNIIANNVRAFNNILSNRACFGSLINVASGAEFDLDTDIDQAREQDIWQKNPQHSYGLSKNLIARMVQQSSGCFNLRLFGCFDPGESNLRPVKRCQEMVSQGLPFVITGDRPFDMVSVRDFAQVVSAVLDGKVHDKDLNVVYNKKYTLGEMLKIYCELHDYDRELVQIQGTDQKSYTGNSDKLQSYSLPLLGLEQSLKEYA